MARSAALLLLALGCGCALLPAPVAAVEDVAAMVQTGASFRPSEEEEPKRSAFGSFFNALATGASVDGDSTMSSIFSKAGSLADALKQSTATPEPGSASQAEHLTDLGRRLQDWGSKTQKGWEEMATSGEGKPAEQIVSGIKSTIASVIPDELKSKAAQLRSKAAKAKETLTGLSKAVANLEAGATEETKAKAKENLEMIGGLLKKRLEKGVDANSRDAQNIRKLAALFRDDSESAADASPLAGINGLASGLRRVMGDRPAPEQQAAPQPVAAQPLQPQPAAVPMQQQQPMFQQPQPVPPQQQQWGAPQQAWQPVPGMMPMAAPGAYPMGAPPAMPQYPMGGMAPYLR